jgi:hypothetical protein
MSGEKLGQRLHRQNERSEGSAEEERQEWVKRTAKVGLPDETAQRNHGCAPARISRPFSKP